MFKLQFIDIDQNETLECGLTQIKFPAGEVHVRLNDRPLSKKDWTHCNITCRLNDSDDLMYLVMATDAIRQAFPLIKINLITGYFPGARQDRVTQEGEALGAKVYAKIINQQNYGWVQIIEPHSDVVTALIDRCKVKNIDHMIADNVIDDDIDVVVCPDAGAVKRISSIVSFANTPHPEIVYCSKQRDTKTGKLSNFKVHSDNLDNKSCVIIDDIGDGFGSHIAIANLLREKKASEVRVFVTHGIFSKGYAEPLNTFDKIITTDSYRSADSYPDSIITYKIL